MKKFIACFVLMITIFGFSTEAYAEPKVRANGAVLIDGGNGRVLWGKNEEEPLAMASTTKIMTAIVALEMGNLYDVITVSKNAAKAAEVNIDLKAGEEYYLEDLLYALMLKSANDVAVAIAEHIGGSVEGFADIMNSKAFDIGAYNTEFVTPNGLDSGNHHSTAKDMALIAAYAIKNENFLHIINTKSYGFNSVDGKRHFDLMNTNRLLNEYNGAIGVKTGFTNKAGHCFVGAAKRDEITLVSTVLASGWGNIGKEAKWTDTKSILNFGFENYDKYVVMEDGTDMGEIEVLNSETKKIGLETEKEITAVLSADEKESLKIIKVVPQNVKAPIEKGDRVGFLRIYIDDFLLGETDVVAKDMAERKSFYKSAQRLMVNWI